MNVSNYEFKMSPNIGHNVTRSQGLMAHLIYLSITSYLYEIQQQTDDGSPPVRGPGVPSQERTFLLMGGDPLIGLDRSHDFEIRGPPVRGPGVPSIEWTPM